MTENFAFLQHLINSENKSQFLFASLYLPLWQIPGLSFIVPNLVFPFLCSEDNHQKISMWEEINQIVSSKQLIGTQTMVSLILFVVTTFKLNKKDFSLPPTRAFKAKKLVRVKAQKHLRLKSLEPKYLIVRAFPCSSQNTLNWRLSWIMVGSKFSFE